MNALCCSGEEVIGKCSEESPLIIQRVNERSLLFRGGGDREGQRIVDPNPPEI